MRLKEIRKNKNLSQQYLADTAEISLRTYQRIESGERKADVNVAIKLAKKLETTVEDIWGTTELDSQ